MSGSSWLQFNFCACVRQVYVQAVVYRVTCAYFRLCVTSVVKFSCMPSHVIYLQDFLGVILAVILAVTLADRSS